MPTWYHLTIQSAGATKANRADAFETSLIQILAGAPRSARMEVYCDGLPGEGRIYWLSQDAYDAARELAAQYGAEPYPGPVDMRFLTPLSF